MDHYPFDSSESEQPIDSGDQTVPDAAAGAEHKWEPLPPGYWAPPETATPESPPTWSPAYGDQQHYGAGEPPTEPQPPFAAGDTQLQPLPPPYTAGATEPQPPYGAGQPQPPAPPYGQPPYGQPPYGQYGQPPTGYGYGGQPPYGASPGFGGAGDAGGAGGPDGPDGPGGAPGPSGKRAPRTGRKVLLGVAVAALIAAAAGGGELIGRNHTTTGAPSTQTLPSPAPTSKSTSQTKLNVSAIAGKVDPETVDITSILSTENEEAEGTGMILTSNGEVLTNNHVIEGATSITAQVDGKGQKYTVKVLGTDATDDVALVMLEGASGLPAVTVGNSSAITVGDPVVAIGNALGLGGTPTVTSGIISALGRSVNATDAGASTSEHLSGMLQTDAPINPGNSGGPLVDASGQVIGMDTAALTGSGTQTASNIGFAIPIDRALAIANQIQKGASSSTIQLGSRGIMGIDAETVAQAEASAQSFLGSSVTIPVNYGAVVEQVLSGYPAAKAGISDGDVIVGLNGERIASPTALTTALKGDKEGKTVSVTWVDGSGTRHTSSITLVAGPPA
jgi:S1-C subfamily serine protease